MKKVKNILLSVYCLILLLAGVLYVLGDFCEVDMAVLSETSETMMYMVQMVMILLTLGLVPLSLRLFKFGFIHRQLVSLRESALLKWGIVRMSVLGVLLVSNTLLYYMYAYEPAFGYLAVMVLLTMPFILPTMSRCQAETEEEKAEDDRVENEEKEDVKE